MANAANKAASSGTQYGVLGVVQHGKGHVALYGDSNCLDSSHMNSNCYQFLVRPEACGMRQHPLSPLPTPLD